MGKIAVPEINGISELNETSNAEGHDLSPHHLVPQMQLAQVVHAK
jgi:hypothetical protein